MNERAEKQVPILPNMLAKLSTSPHICNFVEYLSKLTNLEVFLLCFLFNLPLHNMQYEPLNETKNEIRVLRFLGPFRLSAEKSIECKLENVPLEEGSFYPQLEQSYTPTQKYPIVWDEFTKCVDLRDATLEKLPLGKDLHVGSNQALNQPTSPRFAWGDFEALSYTWGDLNDVKSIIVNGMRKDVTKNLEAALRALRDLKETHLGMRYWVDSLCINQEDREGERDAQVKRMKEIYSRARAVIVWLGQEAETDKTAVRIMRHLCWNSRVGEKLKLPEHLRVGAEHSLLTFAQKPYWNRAWIIQELAMNQNSTLILCGKHQLTRKMLQLGAKYFQKSRQISEDQPLLHNHDQDPDARLKTSRVYRLASLTFKSDEVKLDPLMHLVRRANARDDRDKVYSILGLLDPVISQDITPNYSLPVQKVYRDFMMSIINYPGGLGQIAYAGIHPTENGWASWECDWRIPFGRHNIQHLRSRSASGDLPAKIRFEPGKSGPLLVCSGCHVDTVDGAATEPSSRRPTQSCYDSDRYDGRMPGALQQTLLMDHPKPIPGQNTGYSKATTGRFDHGAIKDVLLQLPWSFERSTAKSPANFRPISKWCELLQSSYFQKFDEFRKHNQDFRIGGQSFRSFFPPDHPKGIKPKILLHQLRLAVLSLEQRALITTESGRLGLAPAAVRQGDIIAILFGCNFPVVLRPCLDDMYQVIGECYVHELMDGKMFSQEHDGYVPERKFVLR